MRRFHLTQLGLIVRRRRNSSGVSIRWRHLRRCALTLAWKERSTFSSDQRVFGECTEPGPRASRRFHHAGAGHVSTTSRSSMPNKGVRIECVTRAAALIIWETSYV